MLNGKIPDACEQGPVIGLRATRGEYNLCGETIQSLGNALAHCFYNGFSLPAFSMGGAGISKYFHRFHHGRFGFWGQGSRGGVVEIDRHMAFG